MDRILISLKKENGPRASSAPALGLNTIIFKHVYWYMQQTQVSVYRTIGPLVKLLSVQMLRVSRHENIFILFLLAIKTAGSAQKLRVGRVSGNTAIFLFTPYIYSKHILDVMTSPILDRSPIKWRQYPIMTIAVDLDVKQQINQNRL